MRFDEISVRAAVAHFIDAYRVLTHVEQTLRFRVVVEGEIDE